MTLAPQRNAFFLFALYVSGMLALLFHLATEEHYITSSPGAESRPVITHVCPCQRGGHVPHAASDHEANQTTDEPRADSLLQDLQPSGLCALAPVLSPEQDLVPLPAPARVPIAWELHPPEWGSSRPCDQPRAPPTV